VQANHLLALTAKVSAYASRRAPVVIEKAV